ncbi:NPCBM/NEW2 domain-containing protein [Kitasatospora sp. NPDC006697]|uniref:NPCBM/NEW2 domain-containing protein n=1 Tax=Kitasatospora sp. NPDC006697 TaxID=3364020 RepID=UPI0036B59A7D
MAAMISALTGVAGLALGFFGLPAAGVASPTAAARPTVTVTVPGPAITVTAASTVAASDSASPQSPAAAPGGGSLTGLRPSRESDHPLSGGSATMNTQSYSDALLGNPCGAPYTSVYDLNRSYKQLTGLLGIDDSSQNVGGDVQIDADGQHVQLAHLALDHTVPVDINVTGVQRLTITYWTDAHGGAMCLTGNPTIVFANPRLTT